MRKETEEFKEERLTVNGVGSVTLVGVDTSNYPVYHGNCFSVYCNDGKSYKVCNFNYENYMEITKRLFIVGDTKVSKIGERHVIIADERIPKEWYDQRWCSICTPLSLLPPQQQLEDKLDELRGDKTYTQVGPMTIVKQTLTASEDSKLDPEWSFEEKPDICIIDDLVDPDVNKELVSTLSKQILKDMEKEGLIPPEKSELLTEEQEMACMDGFIYCPYIPITRDPKKDEKS